MSILSAVSPHAYMSRSERDALLAELREATQALRDLLDCPAYDPTPVEDMVDTSVPYVAEPGPNEVDYSDYQDVLEGLDDGDEPTAEDWREFGEWAEGLRSDRDYEEHELAEAGIRHHIDVYA